MKLFELVKTIDNEKYFVKVFESSYYSLNVVRSKEFNYKRLEVSPNGDNRFIPTLHISDSNLYDNNSDADFEIEIQTTSYGSLNEEVFSYFIEVQQKVLEYIEEVKNIIENE